MSKLLTIQALFALCFGGLLLRLVLQAVRGNIPRNRAIIWAGVWSLGLIMVMNPSLSFHLARWLGVARGTDAITYVAIAFLSVMIFRAFQLIDDQDRELSRLTTELAIYQWESSRESTSPSRPHSESPPSPNELSPP